MGGFLMASIFQGWSPELASSEGVFYNRTSISQTDDPPKKDFRDHGVASPYAHPRGIIATEDGAGNNVLLIWLFDHRGSYGLLSVDVNTGKTRQFSMPFDVGGDAVYTSILASNGKLYTLYNSHFVEFDPESHSFTFQHQTTPRMAMSMTEDDQGRIWAVTYPNSGVVRYDPNTGEFKDYGSIHAENWAQYPRHIAVDKKGWAYVGLGNTNRQIVAFDPESGERFPVLEEEQRGNGMAYVYRDKNGKVYGKSTADGPGDWFQLYKGKIKNIGQEHKSRPVEFITGRQSLTHLTFPDGQRVKNVDLINRTLTVQQSDDTSKKVTFDYDTDGSWVLNVVASPDKKHIVGGSSFPFRLFQYDVRQDAWKRTTAYGQFNAFATNDQSIFFGSYPRGHLMKWDYMDQIGVDLSTDPDYSELLYTCEPTIYRPHRVLALPDNQTVLMGGTPAYGYTGGGLLFYDIPSGKAVLLDDESIAVNQSTKSLTELNDGNILGGTTTSPGTGGEKKANLAYLYLIDPDQKAVKWKESMIPGMQDYSDLITREDGLVYGIANYDVFFVFDPSERSIIHQHNFRNEHGRAVASQSPQIFVRGEDHIYVLLQKGIYRVDESTFELELIAHSPQPITTGGAYLDNHLYFISGSHLFSYGPL